MQRRGPLARAGLSFALVLQLEPRHAVQDAKVVVPLRGALFLPKQSSPTDTDSACAR